MKILQLCLRVPFPPRDGGAMAMHSLTHSLAGCGAKVKVLALNTAKHHIAISEIPEWYKESYSLESVFVDTEIKYSEAFSNLFQSGSYNIQRFDCAEMHKLLISVLTDHQFDVIQIESLYMCPYVKTIRNHSKAKVVLRAHNVEYKIWERLALQEGNPIRKLYLKFLAKRLKRYEMQAIKEVDALIPISIQDKVAFEQLGYRKPIIVAPIGLTALDSIDRTRKTETINFYHLGSMDWLPNIEALDWLMVKVIPLLKGSEINMKIYLAGNKMPDRFFKIKDERIVVEEKVANASDYISNKSVMLVPLLSGGGMRVKIVEALCAGKAVISTTIGAEGINYIKNKNIVIADTPEEFASAILNFCHDHDFLKLIQEGALKLAKQDFDPLKIGDSIIEFYKNMIQ